MPLGHDVMAQCPQALEHRGVDPIVQQRIRPLGVQARGGDGGLDPEPAIDPVHDHLGDGGSGCAGPRARRSRHAGARAPVP